MSGFETVRRVDADAVTACHALTAEVDLWWDAAHSYSGKAENFSLDARAGGCFCERLDTGGSVEHMRVVFADPGRMLRLSGGLGQLAQPVDEVQRGQLLRLADFLRQSAGSRD